jgi:hypothetical protein
LTRFAPAAPGGRVGQPTQKVPHHMQESPSADIGFDGFAGDPDPANAVSRIVHMIEKHAQGVLEFHGIRDLSNIPTDVPHEVRCAISALNGAQSLRTALAAGCTTEAVLNGMRAAAAFYDLHEEISSAQSGRLKELGVQQIKQLERGKLKDYGTASDRRRLWDYWTKEFHQIRADNPKLSVNAIYKIIAQKSAKAGKKSLHTGKPFSARTVLRAIEAMSKFNKPL